MKFKPSIFGIFIILMGVGGIIWGSSVLKSANASSAWPSVPGEVTESKVERTDEKARRNGRTTNDTTYRHQVHYRYEVGGVTYSCGKVSFGEYGSNSPRHAREVVGRYPKGKAVEVYYDPENPEVAVLEPGVSWSSYGGLGAGMVFIIAGIAVCCGKGRSNDRGISL